jgi:hypothetical protein
LPFLALGLRTLMEANQSAEHCFIKPGRDL